MVTGGGRVSRNSASVGRKDLRDQIDVSIRFFGISVGQGMALVDADRVGAPVSGAALIVGDMTVPDCGDIRHMAPGIFHCGQPVRNGAYAGLLSDLVSCLLGIARPAAPISPRREGDAQVLIDPVPSVVGAGYGLVLHSIEVERLPIGIGIAVGRQCCLRHGGHQHAQQHGQGQEDGHKFLILRHCGCTPFLINDGLFPARSGLVKPADHFSPSHHPPLSIISPVPAQTRGTI